MVLADYHAPQQWAEPYTSYVKPVVPGGTVDFTHHFTNTGRVTESFDLTVRLFADWSVTLQVGAQRVSGSGAVTLTLPSVPPGATLTYQILVSPLAQVPLGTTTEMLVMVKSQRAAWLTASALSIAVAEIRPGEVYFPLVGR